MPADERIKVIFRSVDVRDDSDPCGDGEFYFIASVGGESVGDRNHIFNAVEGHTIDLPQSQWSKVINVQNRSEVEVSFQVKEQDVFFDDILHTIRRTLRRPYRQCSFLIPTRHFILEWYVELSVGGAFGLHPPNSIFACRQAPGSVNCTTVSGNLVRSRIEFHPVRPVPTAAASLPMRPVIPGAAVNNAGPTNPTATSPINIFPNPSVIPILGPPVAAPAGPHQPEDLDSANWANSRNAAKIEFTYYVPNTMNFTDDDTRLEWSATALAGGATVSFLNTDGTVSATGHGRRVMVYGTRAGEILLRVRFNGAQYATYRALVLNLKRVPCRVNILNGTTNNSTPRAAPNDVRNHINIANRFLRQLGVELALDTNATRRHNARATGIPGIFRIRVPRRRSRRVVNTSWCTLRNYRAGVINFAYIHSDRRQNLGAATDYPANNAGASITDPPAATAGTQANPSTSWIRPTGVGIGAGATTGRVTMNLIAANQRAGHPQLCAMYVTDACGGARVPANNHQTIQRQREYAGTMTHEFGHILNLGHRVEGVPETAPGAGDQRDMTAADAPATLNAGGIFWDGLLHPPHENVMQWWDPSTIAQDFDIIQARAVHRSPLVVAAPSMAPAVAAP